MEFSPDAALITKFFHFYEEDIKTYFPDFRLAENGKAARFAVLRDMVIANVFVASLTDDGTAIVQLNYTIPKFRDYKVGHFIFDRERDFLLSKGICKLVYPKVFNAGHKEFLKRMGFQAEVVEGKTFFVKCLQRIDG